MNERDAYIALNLMEKIGPVGVRSLVELLGSAAAIFEADARTLERAHAIGPDAAAAIVAQRDRESWLEEAARAVSVGGRPVTCIDPDYPAPLLDIHDPPLALMVRGDFRLRDRLAMAVVGTRRPSHYARGVAEQCAFQLAKAGFVVVSGLAEGIDTVAHRACLEAGGRTLAVLGSGMGHLYPPSNTELADRIAAQGAVLSEFPFDRRPDRTTFPMRNRIVSGLCMGVVVVEAGARSGALITARGAADQGRHVFAVPGRIDSPRNRGCHDLIREGAVLFTSIDDVLSELDLLLKTEVIPMAAPAARTVLMPPEADIVAALRDGEQNVDALIRTTGLAAAAIGSLLLQLELKRIVRMRPGRIVELIE